MNWKSTAQRYGRVAIALHWISAGALSLLVVSGFGLANALEPLVKLALLRTHAFLGATVLALTIARMLWWLIDRKPELPAVNGRWQAVGARLVHRLLYTVILIMGASGLGMLIVSGARDIVLGSSASMLPDFSLVRPHIPHVIGSRLLIALTVLHVCAALYHQFVLRDRALARMGMGSASHPHRAGNQHL